MRKTIFGLLLVASGAIVAPALAVPVVTDFTGGGGPFGSFYGSLSPSGDVVGYAFTADVDLTVTDLGVYSDIGGDGVLDSSHMVGLWDATSQALLGSVSADSTGTLVGEFYYAALGGAINLSAGSEYVLGAMYASDDLDSYFSGPGSVTTQYISMTAGVAPSIGDLGFVFPTLVSAGNLGRFGPNMLAEPTMTTGIPEPSSLLLVGLGLMGLVSARRRNT